MAAVCPSVPAGSAVALTVVLILLGCRMRTAGPVTMAGGVPQAAGLTPCCRGWVRECWLFNKDSLRAGRLFCGREVKIQSKNKQTAPSTAVITVITAEFTGAFD